PLVPRSDFSQRVIPLPRTRSSHVNCRAFECELRNRDTSAVKPEQREPMRSPHLPEPAGKAAPPVPVRPLSGWSTVGWAVLAFVAWLAAEALVLIAFLARWFASNPGVPIDVDKVAHNGYVVSIAAIASMAVQCGIVIFAVRRAQQPVAAYLGLVRRPH